LDFEGAEIDALIADAQAAAREEERGARHHCRASTQASRMRAVERAVEAMRQRLGEPLPLGVLARAALSSPYHFNRFFRQVTGLPPCRYLSALRLETA